MFSGSFIVTYNSDDSIKILRSHDQYTWKFPLSNDSVSTMSSGPTWGISFTFNLGKKLKYFENRSGGGGYFRTTFEGVK
jgi:hypothetical protein